MVDINLKLPKTSEELDDLQLITYIHERLRY